MPTDIVHSETFYTSEEKYEDIDLSSKSPARRHKTLAAAIEEDMKVFDDNERRLLKYFRVTVAVTELTFAEINEQGLDTAL